MLFPKARYIFIVALILCGCQSTSSTRRATTDTTRAIPIGPSLGEAVRAAAHVFVGRIESVRKGAEGDVLEINVVETLKGDSASHVSVALNPVLVESSNQKADGVFITDDAVPANVLYDGMPTDIDRREVVRLMAGVPAVEPEPTDSEVAKMGNRADLVVFGTSTPITKPKSAIDPDVSRVTVDVIEVLKGTTEGSELDVVRGPLPDSPGRPWSFEPGDEMPGVFFLERQGERYVTVSPMPPQLIERQQVKDVLTKD